MQTHPGECNVGSADHREPWGRAMCYADATEEVFYDKEKVWKPYCREHADELMEAWDTARRPLGAEDTETEAWDA